MKNFSSSSSSKNSVEHTGMKLKRKERTRGDEAVCW